VVGGIVAAAGALAAPHSADPGPVRDDGRDGYGSWTREPFIGTGTGTGIAQLAGRGASGGPILQLPTRTITEWTPAQVKDALRAGDSGTISLMADLVEAVMADDRVQGVLSTRTHGLLGLECKFFGEQEQVEALEGHKALGGHPGVPGDWTAMVPECELAQLTAWGILLGVGLGELVEGEEHGDDGRIVPTLKIWHPRWLRWDLVDSTWKLMTSEGEIEITPGDGRWVMYLPYGSQRPWTLGAWRPIAFAWVLKQFALHDRARHSEVLGSPWRVGKATGESTEGARENLLRWLRSLGRETAMVLPQGWEVSVVEATGQSYEIYGTQIEWADRAIAITLAGQFVTTEGTKGFSNGNIHAEIKRDLIVFTAETLSTTLRAQVVVPWANDNWGDRDLAPWPRWDTTPPIDKQLEALALATLGDAIGKLDTAMAGSGKRVDAVELASKFGVPLLDLPKQKTKAASVPLAPTDAAKVIRVDEARAGMELAPWGDDDGLLSVEAFAAKVAAPPAPEMPAAPAQVAPVDGQSLDTEAASEAPLEDNAVADLARKMTELGIPRCEHAKLNRCRLCGIERVRDVAMGPDGAPQWSVAWRPIGSVTAPAAAPEQVAA
jgi:hypothetical protein